MAQAGLLWSIKRSFAAYVARLPDGRLSLDDGVRPADGDQLYFALDAGAHDLSFAGAVRFTGHFGMLSVTIAAPSLLLDAPELRGTMLAGLGGAERRPLVHFRCRYSDDAMRLLAGDVRLAADAVALFGGTYGEGECFDDFEVLMPGSGEERVQ
ncbi:HtaA domain-containing protein [Niveispirillum fermenti]|uniref:HtaA domain-containing protein n=1 Tax=Niveispirillum fermenti TaxID=1233113 RepID=UPI003A8C26B1